VDWNEVGSSGLLTKAQILTLFGPNGVGKTTLACAFDNSAIIDLEDGSNNNTDVKKRWSKSLFPTLKEFKALLSWVLTKEHSYKTLVIDSIESLESLIHLHICTEDGSETKSIEDIGYGKGYVKAREHMEEIMHTFQKIRDDRGMYVVIVGHSQVKTFTDPSTNQAYDRYIMRANDKLASVVKDLSDTVLFIKQQVFTEKSKVNPNKAKASSTGERVIYTEWSHAHDAKTRYSLPEEIPYTLENKLEVVETIKGKSGDDLMKEITALKTKVSDKEKIPAIDKALLAAKGNSDALISIKARLVELTK
jgi:AAA domain